MFRKLHLIVSIVILLCIAGYFAYEHFYSEFGTAQADVVEIVFAENLTSLNPYTFTESNDQRLRQIYEPLVKLDSDLSIKPAIANSFGQIDNSSWEFSLNPRATFHDGTKVTAEIVKMNFERFKTIPAVKSLVESVDKVLVINERTFVIRTKQFDPSLLNKLALLFITPNQPLTELEKNPNGTGPYLVKKIQSDKLLLSANPNYYGRKPKYPKLIFSAIADQFERYDHALTTPRVALVYPMSAQLAKNIDETKLKILKYPTTSVNFFIFNQNRKTFQSKELRKFFTKIISDDILHKLTDELWKPTDQFLSEGVFGYDSSIDNLKIASSTLGKAVRDEHLVGFKFKIALPLGLETFQEVLTIEFEKVGLQSTVDLISPEQISSQEVMKNYDLIFLGWKTDFGDGMSFFQSMVQSDAGLNLGKYKNSTIDNLIHAAENETDEKIRLQKIREASRIIAIEDPYGIPLFENEAIYAVNTKYKYTPRFDGFFDIENLIPLK